MPKSHFRPPTHFQAQFPEPIYLLVAATHFQAQFPETHLLVATELSPCLEIFVLATCWLLKLTLQM
jgi:hypothetical protein